MNWAFLQSHPRAVEWLTASIILGAFLLVWFVLSLFRSRMQRVLKRFFNTALVAAILKPIHAASFLVMLTLGLIAAETNTEVLEPFPRLHLLFVRGCGILLVFLVVVTLIRIVSGCLNYYAAKVAQNPDGPQDIRDQVALIRKTLTAVLYVLLLFYVLGAFGVNTAPLLASGAIGGLAVAWAFQDTLSNLFAGYFVTLDQGVRVGDYIRLSTGEEGFLQVVGWRNSRLRLLTGSIVLVPNSKLGQALLTNFSLPDARMRFTVACRVGQDNRLEAVEPIVLDVAQKIQEDVAGADPDFTPAIRWREITETSILFNVVLGVLHYEHQFLVQSEFLRTLHIRLREEGIKLSTPSPTVMTLPEGEPPKKRSETEPTQNS